MIGTQAVFVCTLLRGRVRSKAGAPLLSPALLRKRGSYISFRQQPSITPTDNPSGVIIASRASPDRQRGHDSGVMICHDQTMKATAVTNIQSVISRSFHIVQNSHKGELIAVRRGVFQPRFVRISIFQAVFQKKIPIFSGWNMGFSRFTN